MAAISGNLQPVVFEFLRGHVSSLMLQEMERMSVTCTSMLSRENHIFFFSHAKPGSEEEYTVSVIGWSTLKYLYSYWMDCHGVLGLPRLNGGVKVDCGFVLTTI